LAFVVFPEWIYEVIWSSACPALLQCPRRNQVAPGIVCVLRIVPYGAGDGRFKAIKAI